MERSKDGKGTVMALAPSIIAALGVLLGALLVTYLTTNSYAADDFAVFGGAARRLSNSCGDLATTGEVKNPELYASIATQHRELVASAGQLKTISAQAGDAAADVCNVLHEILWDEARTGNDLSVSRNGKKPASDRINEALASYERAARSIR